jgi:hypothetical protein
MDPNLEKIKNSHSKAVKKGRLGLAILQAKDYLEYIILHGEDRQKQINRELRQFTRHLKSMRRKYHGEEEGRQQEEAAQEQDELRTASPVECPPGNPQVGDEDRTMGEECL